jgi:hypothetical protein
MKPRRGELKEAQSFIDTFERIRQSGLVLEAQCLNRHHRRVAYIAQATIAAYQPAPKKPVGFAYKGMK